MFTIYQKTVGGRVSQRYFKNWDNAKKALLKEKAEVREYGWIVTSVQDHFNPHKGIYVYQVDGKTDGGEDVTFALLEGHFED